MFVHRLLAMAALVLAASSAHATGVLADVSIFDRATRQELPLHWHEGRAYVVGRPGAEYQIIVRNRLGEDLLAVVSVDGVNAVSGETAGVQQRGYVLSPWQAMRIGGWRKSLEETASFYFTSLGDSYAGRTGRGENVGVIGVALFRRAAPPPSAANIDRDTRAPQESSAMRKRLAEAAPAAAAPLGTGHGRSENSPVREVSFERATEQPAETISIYYDSFRNLVAQGVIAPQPSPRDPSPFPARFVPDPPR
jgi:hypothetical protein